MGFTVFVSHAHEDAQLVDLLKTVIEQTLDDVDVRSSSSRPSRGGIEPGASWLDWIHQSVANSDATLIVLTSQSASRPWILWEAGAVSGVSTMSAEAKSVIPVVFELPMEAVPGPMRHQQTVDGSSREGITDLLEALYARCQRPSQIKFQQLLQLEAPRYVRDVSALLAQRQTEAKKSAAFAPQQTNTYSKTFQGEDLDLNIVNFTSLADPDDMSGVAIVNKDGDWMIEIDVESPLRSRPHAADMRFRRASPEAIGRVSFRVDSGEVFKREEIIDLSQTRHHKFNVEYVVFRHNSRIAKITIRPVDNAAREPNVFCLDSVSVYSLPENTHWLS